VSYMVMLPAHLDVVVDPRQIEASHRSFIKGLARARARATKLVRRTWYWVYDPATETFSPSKFTGYVAMDFVRYEAAANANYEGAKFDGWISQNAIASVLGEYAADASLAIKLKAWAQSVLGPHALEGIDPSKWRFVSLPVHGVGGLAALAGGWEGSEELVEAMRDARSPLVRTPPAMD
jgi:hypothetical protein